MAHTTPPAEIGRRTDYQGQCLEYQTITYRDAYGAERKWETVERIAGRRAVVIIPWLMPSDRLLLIRQYRPPARGMVIEFPAGLIDDGETAEQAAVRELKEETGFTGGITQVTPPTYNSPGLSGETVHHVFITINEQDPINAKPVAEPDGGESIEILPVPRKDLPAFIRSECAGGGRFDSKVMAYVMGMTDVTRTA